MGPEEYDWHVNLIKSRNEYLKLTTEQAGEIYNYEKDKNQFSKKQFLSTWEEWDYEAFVFKQILTPEQFRDYELNLSEKITAHEQSLKEQDKQMITAIDYFQEILTYYETVFLPDLIKAQLIAEMPRMYGVTEKVAFLKLEYKSYLIETKKELLISCFRNYRTFAPNTVRDSLLRHKLAYLWPDYTYFRHSADEATKAVISYVRAQVRHLPEDVENLLTKKISELKEFIKVHSKRYYGEPNGWHVFGQLSSEEEKVEQVMQLFLLDPDQYGLKLNKGSQSF